jgi:endonuclease YncB( thermonuclease family)
VVGVINFKLKDCRLWFFRAFVNHVVNGDTILATIDKGFNDFTIMRLRLNGVDAPDPEPRIGSDEEKEHERARGIKARDRLAELIAGREVLVRAYRTAKIDRFLVDVFLPGDSKSTANKVLLDERLATPFERFPHRRHG